jgi:uncharacterized protein
MKALKLFLGSILTIFGVIYLFYVGYIYTNQANMVFLANKLNADYKFEFAQKFEELNIASFDSKKINGLLFKTSNPKGLIFYLHGNSGSLDSWGNNAKIYTDLGYDFFILDYRGFGKSEGTIENEEQVNRDTQIVYNELSKRYDKNKITIIGYSIGTGVASVLASNNYCKALILQAPFYNLLAFSSTRVPFYPNFLKKFSFENNINCAKIKVPIYLFHGTNDQLFSIENSERLIKILKSSDQFFKLENQNHIGINQNLDFQEKLNRILE